LKTLYFIFIVLHLDHVKMNNKNSRLFFIPFRFFSKIYDPKWQTCKPSFIQLCFWILSSKTTLFKAFSYSFLCIGSCKINNHSGFFHILFSALDHVKSTTIQAFIHSHCGLGFCHPKRQHLRLFVIFIALQFDHVKWTTWWKAFFSFTIGIWWNL